MRDQVSKLKAIAHAAGARSAAYRPAARRAGVLLLAVASTLAVACGAFFAARSLSMAISLSADLPFQDQWAVVQDYFRLADDKLSFSDLFSRHNEHRIATTRLVLFIDAMAFSMRLMFPILVQYAALAIIAYCITWLAIAAEHGRKAAWLGFIAALGIAWSTVQLANLAVAFQVCFPLVHLFALLSFISLSAALSETGYKKWLWLAAACASDFLGVVSLGSGILIGPAAAAMVIWARKFNRVAVVFFVVHLAFVIYYFSGSTAVAKPESATINEYATFILKFLGQPLAAGTTYQTTVGLIVLVVCVCVGVWLTLAAIFRTRPLDSAIVIIFTGVTFVLLEAVAVAWFRVKPYGLSPIYSTPAVILTLCLLAIAWKSTSYVPVRIGVAILTCISVIRMNDPRYEYYWRQHSELLQAASAALVRGERPEKYFTAFPGMPETIINQLLDEMRREKLGPFRNSP